MYGIKLYNYVPEPKPAVSDRIVAAHYYPAWTKGATDVHHGFEDLHDYPERTPLVGYYDGSDPKYMDWEIKWALEHGVNCFIYCWYRKKENFGKPVTVSDLRLGEGLHKGFFGARYRDRMNFSIMFEASGKWGGTDRRDLLENLMPFWIETYFRRKNYLKIDNKPVLFVYDNYSRQIADAFGSAEKQREAFDACRRMARDAGFDGLIIAEEYRHEDPARLADSRERGYDFTFAYCWRIKEPAHPTDAELVEIQTLRNRRRLEADPERFVPTASCMWDPTPRFKSMPDVFRPENHPCLYKLSPEGFRELLARIRRLTDGLPADSYARRMLMLDNWNEWDEGHYLLPSCEFGFGYLQAIREVMTSRENLPDYRLPAELGFGSYNHGWAEPDKDNRFLRDR